MRRNKAVIANLGVMADVIAAPYNHVIPNFTKG